MIINTFEGLQPDSLQSRGRNPGSGERPGVESSPASGQATFWRAGSVTRKSREDVGVSRVHRGALILVVSPDDQRRIIGGNPDRPAETSEGLRARAGIRVDQTAGGRVEEVGMPCLN